MFGVLVMMLLSLGLGGCHLRPLLYDVSVSPDIISPNADGTDDATNIEYKLSRNASISIYFEDADGKQYYFRQDRPRSAGEYRVQWGGTVNQRQWLQLFCPATDPVSEENILAEGREISS